MNQNRNSSLKIPVPQLFFKSFSFSEFFNSDNIALEDENPKMVEFVAVIIPLASSIVTFNPPIFTNLLLYQI